MSIEYECFIAIEKRKHDVLKPLRKSIDNIDEFTIK